MKFFKLVILIGVTASLIMAGCSKETDKTNITSMDDVEVSILKEYSGTYVGDNSNVYAIVQKLAGGESIKELDLTDEKIKVTYGYEYSKAARENFFFNAIYLTILVPNATGYHMEADKSFLYASRKNMVTILTENFSDFPDEEGIWEEEVVSNFINENHEKLKELAKNKYEHYFE
jgi:hypothetical protein